MTCVIIINIICYLSQCRNIINIDKRNYFSCNLYVFVNCCFGFSGVVLIMVYTPSVRTLVKERDKTCKLCEGSEQLQIHHIIWKFHGGTDHITNLVLLCSHCHLQQHGKNGRSGILQSQHLRTYVA